MTYQVLARKWRPQDFSGLIGQQPIVTALRNGLAENRIAQAYLFSGIRGVGKTTAARILAKALNCERGPSSELPATDPCNECGSCLDITSGRDIDVQEIDAATYSKVEQIRELTESLRSVPARDRYKVVVLDEVHRLSRQAFDALLKIVEEPPPHLVFIFATTKIDAVPATILSRCQEYQFRRVPFPVMADHLRRISDAEEIEASDAALRLIARAGEGSVRDSVALLDQLATFGAGKIDDHDAKHLLGALDAAIFLRLLSAILEGQGREIAEIVGEIEANGWDPHSVYGQFLVFTRDALQLAMGGRPNSIDLRAEEAEQLTQVVEPFGYENLLRLTQLLLNSETSVRRSEFSILAIQIAWLRAAELPKVLRIEDLLSGRTQAPTPLPEGSVARTVSGTSAPRKVARKTPADPPTQSVARIREPGPDSAPRPKTGSPAGVRPTADRLPAFLDLLAGKSPSLAALLNAGRDNLAFEDGKLLVPEGDLQLAGALKREHNRKVFEELLRETWGKEAAWEWTKGSASTEKKTASADRASADRTPADRPDTASDHALRESQQDPMVRAVLDVFNGSKIQSVETRPQGEMKS